MLFIKLCKLSELKAKVDYKSFGDILTPELEDDKRVCEEDVQCVKDTEHKVGVLTNTNNSGLWFNDVMVYVNTMGGKWVSTNDKADLEPRYIEI